MEKLHIFLICMAMFVVYIYIVEDVRRSLYLMQLVQMGQWRQEDSPIL
jgi:hypothetical protein